MYALIQTLSPRKKNIVIQKKKLTDVGRQYYSFLPSKLKKPELCKIICSSGDKIILNEVAENLNKSLPSVSIEVNVSTSFSQNVSFNDLSIISSSSYAVNRISYNKELWEKPELTRSITENSIVTSSPIIDKNFVEPIKAQTKLKSIVILNDSERINISKFKKATLLHKKDDTGNVQPLSVVDTEMKKIICCNNGEETDGAEMLNFDIYNDAVVNNNADAAGNSNVDTLDRNNIDVMDNKNVEPDLSTNQPKLSKTSNFEANRELDDVPILFIDDSGNVQPLSDVDNDMKKIIYCNNGEETDGAEMLNFDIYNDAVVNNNADASGNSNVDALDRNNIDVMDNKNVEPDLSTNQPKLSKTSNFEINRDNEFNSNIQNEIPSKGENTGTNLKIHQENEEKNNITDRIRQTGIASLLSNKDQKIVPNIKASGINFNSNVMGDALKFGDTKKVGKSSKEKGKKTYPCFYCDKKQLTTMSRHYKTVHKEEAIVQEILEFEPSKRLKGQTMNDNQKYTDYLYSYLRKSAILNHNLQAEFHDQFHTARTRRHSEEDRTISMYSLCTNCSGFYANSYFHKHVKKCTENTKSTLQARLESNAAMGKKSSAINDHLQKVLVNLRRGPIRDIVENDPVIITFGNALSFKHRHHYHQGDMIRARLRCTARFLAILRTITNNVVNSYADFFRPENFDYLFPGINEIGQYNPTTDLYDVPATAAAAGAYIKELCDTYIGMCIRAKDKGGREAALEFMHLYKTDYNKYVTKTVAESQIEMQRNKKIELPTEEDLTLFYSSIVHRRDTLVDDLKNNGFDIAKWTELGEVTTIHLVMFSGRRVGETERLKKGNFSKIERLESNKDGSKNLSDNEIQFLQNFRRVLIRGKLNRTVPLLMTYQDEDAINLYMSFLKEAKVEKHNPYVFALPGHTYKHQRACDNIRKYTAAIKDLKHPERIRGTLFRKNISTLAMSLNLSNGTRTDLYDVLGHSGKINKNIYAQHEFQQQILTIAPILLKASTAVNKFDEEKCENDEDEEDMVQYKNIIPDLNTQIPSSNRIEETDVTDKLKAVSTPVSRNQQLQDEDLKDKNYNPSEFDSDEYDDEYESDNGNRKRKRKSSAPTKFQNNSIKPKRVRWTSEQDEAVAHLYSAYLQRPITQDEIQKVIDSNCSLKGRNVAQVRSRFHKNKNTPKKEKCTEKEVMSTSLSRNNIPLAIYNNFEQNIESKKAPSTDECLEILNSSSPHLLKYTVPQIIHFVNMAIEFDTKDNQRKFKAATQ